MVLHRFRQIGLLLVLVSLVVPAVVGAQGEPLTETFTSEDGTLTFQYPAGWTVVEDQPGFYTLTDGVNAEAPATISMLTTPVVDDVISSWGFDSTIGANLVGNLTSRMFLPSESDNPTEFTRFEDGRDAFLYFHPNADNSQNVIWVLAFEEPTHQAVFLSLLDVPADEAESYRDAFLAVAASVAYTPPEKAPSGMMIWQQEYTMNPKDSEAIGQLSGMGVGPDGTIYLTDQVNGIHVFSPDGEKLGHISEPADASLADVAVAADGTLWAVDAQHQRVLHLDAEGALLETLDTSRVSADTASWSAAEITIGPDEQLYLLFTDDVDQLAYEVQIWDMAGTVQSTFRRERRGRVHMALGPEGNLYFMGMMGNFWATDVEGNSVQNPMMLPTAANTTGLVIAPTGALFCSLEWGEVWYFDSAREPVIDLSQLPLESVLPEQGVYFMPVGLALLPGGDVILADSYKDTAVITRFHFDAFNGMVPPAEPPALTETYTTSDGHLTFGYPTDWAMATVGAGELVLSNSGRALEAGGYGPGDVIFHVSWSLINDVILHSSADTEAIVLATALNTYTTFAEMSADATFTYPEAITLNGRPAARFTGLVFNRFFTVLVLDVDNDAIGIVAMMTSRPVDTARFGPTLLAFAETLTYAVKLPD